MFLSIRRGGKGKKRKEQLESKCLPMDLQDLNNLVLPEVCAPPLQPIIRLQEVQFSSSLLVGSRSEIEAAFRSSSKSLCFSSALLV